MTTTAMLFGALPVSFVGNGYGDGYGYGDGDGDGNGYGDGYGYGYGEYWRRCLQYFAEKWPADRLDRFKALVAEGVTLAYWRSDKNGRAANGGKNAPVQVGTVEEVAGPLEICSRRALHATLIPPKWKGERWWIVALHGEVQGDEEKYGALKREILGECL